LNYLADFQYPKTLHELNAKLTGWLVLLTCFGYPLQVLMVLVVGADSTPVNLSFRLAYQVLSMYLLGYSLFHFKNRMHFASLFSISAFRRIVSAKRSWFLHLIPWAALLLFWFIYGIRLIYDLEYKAWIFREYHKFYIYAWAFGCSLIPAMAILLNIGTVNAKWFSRNIFFFVFLVNIMIVLILLYYAGGDIGSIFGKRGAIVLTGDVKLKGQHLLNGISLSFYGALLILSALTWFVFHHQQLSLFMTIFFVLCFLLGLFNLIAGASRGPLLDLLLISAGIIIVSIFIYIRKLVKYIKRRIHYVHTESASGNAETVSGKSLLYKSLMSLLAVMMLITVFNMSMKRLNVKLSDLAFTERLSKLSDEKMDINATFRIDAWKSAWRQFTVNPLFGDSIINDAGYFYSHNIFMDALMSVGIVGTIPFLVWFFLSFWYFIRLPAYRKREMSVLFVAYLAALLLSMTSGGLFTVPEVWILSAAVIGLSQKYLLEPGTPALNKLPSEPDQTVHAPN
jgi:hypothetical protein